VGIPAVGITAHKNPDSKHIDPHMPPHIQKNLKTQWSLSPYQMDDHKTEQESRKHKQICTMFSQKCKKISKNKHIDIIFDGHKSLNLCPVTVKMVYFTWAIPQYRMWRSHS